MERDGPLHINKELHQRHPHRTVQSISSIRKQTDYRARLAAISTEEPDDVEEEELEPVFPDEDPPPPPDDDAEPPAPSPTPPPSPSTQDMEEDEDVKGTRTYLRDLLDGLPTTEPVDQAIRTYVEETLDDVADRDTRWGPLFTQLKRAFNTPRRREGTDRRPRPRSPATNQQPRAENRTARRRRRFAKTQAAFTKDPGQTIGDIMDDTFYIDDANRDVPSIQDIADTYRERLQDNVFQDADAVTPLRPITTERRDYGPVAPGETKAALKAMKKDTAPGPEKWFTLELAKRIGPRRLSIIFTVWWHQGGPPSSEKSCRTILIYKKEDRKDVGNWRPITIGNILNRLFSKIWDVRLRRLTTFHDRQKAFIPADGCFENVKLLETAITSCRIQRKETNVVFLDLAKVFDTVPHSSIRRALIRQGVHR